MMPFILPVPVECVQYSAQKYSIPPAVIGAIILTENGRPGRISRNRNRTVDIGPMQINSTWLHRLRRLGIGYAELKNNSCLNVDVGTWILAKNIRDRNGDLWKAIGDYHSRRPIEAWRYQRRVWYFLSRLQGRSPPE